MVEATHNKYVDRVLSSNSFEALYHRFKNADSPSKEISESYAALANLRKVCRIDDYTWLHIGDGANVRTASIFTFFSKGYNYSIDPKINLNKFAEWVDKYKVRNITPLPMKFEHITDTFEDKIYNICCVHAHVKLVKVDKKFPNWNYLYSNTCCFEDTQTFSEEYMNQNNISKILEYDDYGILSEKRHVVIYRNDDILK